jgi:ferredoxin
MKKPRVLLDPKMENALMTKVTVKWRDGDTANEQSVLIPTGNAEPLLDLCEDEGMQLPFGCRSGSCGSCRVVVLSGEELLEERSFLEQDTLERHQDEPNVRLACRVKIKAQVQSPQSDLVLLKASPVKFE